jgi:uncharacterized protein
MSMNPIRRTAILLAACVGAFVSPMAAQAQAVDNPPPASSEATEEAESPIAAAAVQYAMASAIAASASPEDRALAREVLVAMGMEGQFAASIETMMTQMKGVYQAEYPAAADVINAMLDSMADRMVARKDEVLDQIAGFYAATIGTEDLKALLEFHRSPLGVRMNGHAGTLTQGGMVLGSQWGQDLAREMLEEMNTELRARGITS